MLASQKISLWFDWQVPNKVYITRFRLISDRVSVSVLSKVLHITTFEDYRFFSLRTANLSLVKVTSIY